MHIFNKDYISVAGANKGKQGTMSVEELTFGVQIQDSRLRFGHIDYLVQPLNGGGRQWVEQHRVNVEFES